MSKYVKIDDIMQYPIRKDHYDRENGDENFIFGIESVMEYIEQLPTVELIRCRECAKYDEDRCYCDLWKAKNQPNDGHCHFAEGKR